jgi:hypothetical protein
MLYFLDEICLTHSSSLQKLINKCPLKVAVKQSKKRNVILTKRIAFTYLNFNLEVLTLKLFST